ncbi:MAG: DUF3892 domain-containing protein [Burkholderiaceae bacterium]
MSNCQITCINKSIPTGGHSHITDVGNPQVPWKRTVEQVIALIESKTDTFYVQDPVSGKTVYVGVVREAGKRPYIRTYADGVWTDNLLSLTFCPLIAA